MPPDDRARTLRDALVDDLLRRNILRSPRVAEAMRAVPRHPFAPWLSLEEAYADRAWIIPGTTPEAPATLSQPTAVALMLEGFDLAPGQRVLEIGAGTGYNAALMAHLVGPAGRVVTVDIEAQLAEAARERLRFDRNVEVVHGDGACGYPRSLPTTGSWRRWARGTCPRPGGSNWRRRGGWSCPCTSGARPRITSSSPSAARGRSSSGSVSAPWAWC